jgi:pyruvate-formate lyase-activating enzyme
VDNIDIDFEKSIKSLNPVTWIYNDDEKNVRQIGYIAEEVYEVDSLRYIVVLDEEDKPLGLRYDLLGVYAIEVLKSALEKINNLEKEVQELKNNK